MKKLVARLAIIILASGCGQKPDAEQVKNYSASISSAKFSESSGRKTIEVSISADTMLHVGDAVKETLSGISSNLANEPYESVYFRVHVPVQDKFGNQTPEEVAHLEYPKAVVSQINYQNILSWGVLNLAKAERVGQASAGFWAAECTNEGNAQFAAEFCGMVNR